MIKRYLNTFKGNSTQRKARRFGFFIVMFLYAFFYSIFFAVTKTFTPPVALFVDLGLGFGTALIADLIVGIGRRSPLIKNDK